VASAIRLPGPVLVAEQGWTHAIGVDIGIKKDASAVVTARKKTGRYQIIKVRKWMPKRGRQVDMAQVRAAIEEDFRTYRAVCVMFDPAQMLSDAQTLKKANVRMREINLGTKTQVELATLVLDLFASEKVDLYDEPSLVRDLYRLQLTEKSYGVRLESPRGLDGHGDVASAATYACYALRDAAFAGGLHGRPPVAVCGGLGVVEGGMVPNMPWFRGPPPTISFGAAPDFDPCPSGRRRSI
jgi:hypothetical protein